MNYSYAVITLLSGCHSKKKIAVELSMIAFEMQNKQVILKWEQVFKLLSPSLTSHCRFLLRSNLSNHSIQWTAIPFKVFFNDFMNRHLIYYFIH